MDDFDTQLQSEDIFTEKDDLAWMDQGDDDTATTPAPIGTLISECADGLDDSLTGESIPF